MHGPLPAEVRGYPSSQGTSLGDFGAKRAPHLTEDEVKHQRVVDAVLGVENLTRGRPMWC